MYQFKTLIGHWSSFLSLRSMSKKKLVFFFVKSKFKQLEVALPIVHLKQLQQDALPIVHHLVQQALYLPTVFAGHLCHC